MTDTKPTPIWENYRNTYPERYLNEGPFDEIIRKHIAQKNPQTAVDIGGGTTGTQALREIPEGVWLLDPFVSTIPEWMAGRVTWNTVQKFDLVILRGSINYLTGPELERARQMVAPNGVLIANTFLNEPEKFRSRPYTTLNGEEGIEETLYDPKTKIINHTLIDAQGKKITHPIFFRSERWFRDWLPGVQTHSHGKNSTTLTWRPRWGKTNLAKA